MKFFYKQSFLYIVDWIFRNINKIPQNPYFLSDYEEVATIILEEKSHLNILYFMYMFLSKYIPFYTIFALSLSYTLHANSKIELYIRLLGITYFWHRIRWCVQQQIKRYVFISFFREQLEFFFFIIFICFRTPANSFICSKFTPINHQSNFYPLPALYNIENFICFILNYSEQELSEISKIPINEFIVINLCFNSSYIQKTVIMLVTLIY